MLRMLQKSFISYSQHAFNLPATCCCGAHRRARCKAAARPNRPLVIPQYPAISPIQSTSQLRAKHIPNSPASALFSSSEAAAGTPLTDIVTKLLNQLSSLMEPWQELGLLDECRVNPRRRGSMLLRDSLRVLVKRFKDMIYGCQNLLRKDLVMAFGRPDPRYLGNYPDLVEDGNRWQREAEGAKDPSKYVREKVHTWLEQHPHVMAQMGLTLDAKGCPSAYDMDHILPFGKAGLNHPINLFVMPKSDNRAFNGWITLEKCMYVGLPVIIRVVTVHCLELAKANSSTQHLVERLQDFDSNLHMELAYWAYCLPSTASQ